MDASYINTVLLGLAGFFLNRVLKKVDEIDQKRRWNFNKIAKMFEQYVPGVRVAAKLEKADPSWFGVPLD